VSAQTYAAPVDPALRAARRKVNFDATLLLSGAMVISGVLTYAFHIASAKALGAAAYGQIAILWGSVFLLAIVLFRPLEQTLSRWIAQRLGDGHELRTVLKAVGWIAAGAFGLVLAAAAASWSLITQKLFDGDDWMTAFLVAAVIGYGASYLVRGVLGGVRWFGGYGVVLLADSVARLVFVVPIVFIASTRVAGAAVVAAAFAGAVAPFLAPRKWLPALRGGTPGPSFDYRGALRFAAPAGVVAAADQLIVNGAPLLVILIGHGTAKAAGIVFAATMLVRAPVYVFQGVAASLLPNFTLLGNGNPRELRLILRRTMLVLGGAGVAIVAGIALVGPTMMGLIYGDEFAASRTNLVLLGASVAFYLAAATFLQALLAVRQQVEGALAWSVSAIILCLTYAAATGTELTRVSAALLAATATNALLHRLLLARTLRARA
jgi:O-antigen/teichoic acid export membrane protein